MTILICFVQILVHFSFQSPGMCAFLSLEHKQYENKMCIHLELFCENILSLSDMPGYRDLASFLFSRLQLYLVSQPCHGWSSPSMALSGFTKIPNLLPAFLSIYLYPLNRNTVLLLFFYTAIPSLSSDIEEGHIYFYQASLEHFHGV